MKVAFQIRDIRFKELPQIYRIQPISKQLTQHILFFSIVHGGPKLSVR